MIIRLLAILLVAAAGLLAQTTAALMPLPKMQFFDNNGNPLAGGKVYTYAAGTSTPLATYTDSTGGASNTNPVILDSAGRANIWLGAAAYKIVLCTSTGGATCAAGGTVLWTVDNVSAPNLGEGDVTITTGHTLTLDDGSLTSLGADLIPSINDRYDLGASGAYWNSAWISRIHLNNDLAVGTNGAYDIGSSTYAWRQLWTMRAYVNSLRLTGCTPSSVDCAGVGGGVMSTNYWSFGGLTDNINDNYLVLSDTALQPVFKWTRKEAAAATNLAVSYVDLVPNGNDTYALGSTGLRWSTGYFVDLDLEGAGSITPPSGDVPVNGTITCDPGEAITSITVSAGILTAYTCATP